MQLMGKNTISMAIFKSYEIARGYILWFWKRMQIIFRIGAHQTESWSISQRHPEAMVVSGFGTSSGGRFQYPRLGQPKFQIKSQIGVQHVLSNIFCFIQLHKPSNPFSLWPNPPRIDVCVCKTTA